jgi:hypothetical protein
MRAKTAALLFLVLVACGKKGDPMPPVPIIPKPATDLSVAQRGPSILLSWSYPSLTTAGKRLEAIDSIVVYRLSEPVVSAEPSRLPPVPPQVFSNASERIDTISREALPGYVAGARIVYTDDPPSLSDEGKPIRYTYAVVTVGAEGRSALSNLASIVPLRVAPPPGNLMAQAPGAAVELSWSAPSDIPVAGYNVYRFPPVGEINELGTPLNAVPVTEPRYLDAPAYGSYRYAVTAVSSAGPPLIQSEPTPTVFVEFRDRQAPPATASVVPLVEGNVVRMLWDAVQAEDLVGYLVYRTVGGNRVALTPTPIAESNFRDPAPPAGVTFTYAVSSVDRNGNESGATESAAVFVPR